jgi:hypothetical protein
VLDYFPNATFLLGTKVRLSPSIEPILSITFKNGDKTTSTNKGTYSNTLYLLKYRFMYHLKRVYTFMKCLTKTE